MATPSTPSFLKPQDQDVSDKSSAEAVDVTPAKTGKGFPRWIVFAAFGILLIAGVAGYLLYRRRRANSHSGNTAAQANSSVRAVATKPAAPVATTDLPLDPFVVNLADAGGHSYARIGLTLQLITPATGEKSETKEATATAADAGPRDMVRDTVINVLNQEQSSVLLAPGGKQHLKQAIRSAVAARDPLVKISDIYFTEFLVQQ
ncbi:MAG: flagellar basal body-associated FliL family protein [Acidobacteriaceae bacterium]